MHVARWHLQKDVSSIATIQLCPTYTTNKLRFWASSSKHERPRPWPLTLTRAHRGKLGLAARCQNRCNYGGRGWNQRQISNAFQLVANSTLDLHCSYDRLHIIIVSGGRYENLGFHQSDTCISTCSLYLVRRYGNSPYMYFFLSSRC